MMKQFFSFLFLTFFVATLGLSQEKMDGDVAITFELKFDGDDQTAALMDGSNMKIVYTKEKRSRATIDLMGGMLLTDVITNADGSFIMLMDVMGQKMKVVPTEEEITKLIEDAEAAHEGEEVVYDKKDTKDILGYTCYKATVKSSEGNVVMYVTEDIKIDAPENLNGQTLDFTQVEGFPLEIIVEEQGMEVRFIATEIGLPSENAFEYDDSDYEEMSFSDLENLGM